MSNLADDQFESPHQPAPHQPARRQPASRWRHNGERRRTSRRHGRPPASREPYAGATVLEDLAAVGHDAAAATVVLARFAALQLVLHADTGVSTGDALETDRMIAQTYLSDTEPFRPGEWQALDSVLRLSGGEPNVMLASALVTAGAAAETWGHGAGARACYLTAQQVARTHGWHAEGATAARAISRLAAA